jgi:hypothetical protein
MKMQEHKIRQAIYHKISKIDDLLVDVEEKEPVVYLENETEEETVGTVVRYFNEEVKELIYPAKPFVVALVYACLLEKHFGEPFYESLSDPDLLHGNDKHFKPYLDSKKIYDEVVCELSEQLEWVISEPERLPTQIRSTIQYFRKEFLIDMDVL